MSILLLFAGLENTKSDRSFAVTLAGGLARNFVSAAALKNQRLNDMPGNPVMPPQMQKPSAPPREPSHEPQAFETDLERHRGSDDDVYGSHGVQQDGADVPFRPGGGVKLTRVGQRRRR